MVTLAAKGVDDVPTPGPWAEIFEDTEVHIERVVAYWSRILKSAERNYSLTEREALALREGLIKFQTYIEGEKIIAITDHAALTWSKTFQNVNRRLLTWGTTFSAYPDLVIVYRAGHVHLNVDPISRLRRRAPYQDGPSDADGEPLTIGEQINDPLKNTFDELGPQFEERLLKVANAHAEHLRDEEAPSCAFAIQQEPPFHDEPTAFTYHAALTSTLVVGIADEEILRWRQAYAEDPHPHNREVLRSLRTEDDPLRSEFPQYHVGD